MTGPRPILTNGKVKIGMSSPAFGSHVSQFDCNVDDFTLATPNFICMTGGNQPWTTCITAFATLLAALYDGTGQIDTATLEEYVGGSYIPRRTLSLGVAGTSVTGNVAASQATVTFRDFAYIPDRMVFLEGAFGIPYHQGYVGLATQFKNLVDDVLNHSGTHVGNWYKSKSNNYIQGFQFWTDTHNKRLRRKRGQV